MTLPVAAAADQEAHADASPATARPATEAALLPRAALAFTAGPVLQQPARPAAAVVRQAVGDAPDERSIRPASRSMTRKAAPHRVRVVRTVARRVEVRHAAPVRRTVHRAVHQATTHRATVRQVVARRSSSSGGLSAVAAFARSTVGMRYVYGAEGNGGYDCSGLTKAAYRRIGVHLPHQSGAQAARAYTISRSQAVPGDLVVGNGHVGIYQGNGMMTDAPGRGRRILYRKMYPGLHIERVSR